MLLRVGVSAEVAGAAVRFGMDSLARSAMRVGVAGDRTPEGERGGTEATPAAATEDLLREGSQWIAGTERVLRECFIA
jgi:hypothetical protein